MDKIKQIIIDFFEDIKVFFTYNSVMGIDIGTTSIKLAEVEKKKGNLLLKNYGFLQAKEYLVRANAAFHTSSLKISEKDTIPFLKILLDEVKPSTKKVIASIPTFGAFFIPVEMPLISVSDTAKSISFQARQYIPIPVNEATIDWIKIGEFNKNGKKFQRILIIGIPNLLIKKYRSIFKNVGLKLIALEVEPNSLARVLTKKGEMPTLIVDIGAESTSIIVVNEGVVQEVGQTDYAGITLTHALGKSLDISFVRAEELKKRRGLSDSGKEYELSTSLYPFLDVIIQECEHVKSSYEKRSMTKVRTITLTGGGANLSGINDYFKSQMGLPIQNPSIIDFLDHSTDIDVMNSFFDRDLAVALGLAFRFHI